MIVKFAKWGNSIALRIPNAVAREIHAEAGSMADIAVVGGKLVVTPVRHSTYDLAELVARINDENRHGQIDTSAAIGAEFA